MTNDTNVTFKVIETNNANKVPFKAGQYIIQDDGQVYYDPTYGETDKPGSIIKDRQQLVFKDHKVHNFTNGESTDEDYLELITDVNKNDICVISRLIDGTEDKYEHKKT